MPKGVRHGEERHVVHSLPLEKSLSEIHRLILSFSRNHAMSPSSPGATARWTLPLRRGYGDFFRMELSVLFPPAQQGFCLLCFQFPNTKRKSNLLVKRNKTKDQQEKRTFMQDRRLFLRLKQLKNLDIDLRLLFFKQHFSWPVLKALFKDYR